MSGNSILITLWRRISKYGFILAMSILAVIAFKTPLQHYVALTRYQHIGIVVFLFGMGYVMQTIWSWRVYSKWARLANIATSIFFCSVGLYFYMNTGLEGYATDGSPQRILVRLTHVASYLFFALVVSLFWVKWAHEDNKLKDAEKAATDQTIPVETDAGGGSADESATV